MPEPEEPERDPRGRPETVRLKFRVASFLGAWLLRAMRASWRHDGPPDGSLAAARAARIAAGRPSPGVIYVLWHSRILLGVSTQADQDIHALISLHGDGEYIARTIERIGLHSVRGSSSRGGARALRGIIETLESGRDVAITPDGPRGPRLVAQAGCIEAAAITGAPIVPLAFECRSAKRLRSWDRFIVPWFFTKVAFRIGEELRVPRELDDASRAAWCRRVEAALDRTHADACAAIGVAPEEREPVAPPASAR
ncbi:MAG: hypothetical protein HMLKMBBP_01469 [Planctomycetes bacterium]|nr:hypothetical protein [Planctomycetota bacterium]